MIQHSPSQNANLLRNDIPEPNSQFELDNIAKKARLRPSLVEMDKAAAQKEAQFNDVQNKLIGLVDRPLTSEAYRNPEFFKRQHDKINEYSDIEAYKTGLRGNNTADHSKGFLESTREAGLYAGANIGSAGVELTAMAGEMKTRFEVAHLMSIAEDTKDPETQRAITDAALNKILASEEKSAQLREFRDTWNKSAENYDIQTFEEADSLSDYVNWAGQQAVIQAANIEMIAAGYLAGGGSGGFLAHALLVAPETRMELDRIEKETGVTLSEEEKWNVTIMSGTVQAMLGRAADVLPGMKGVLKGKLNDITRKATQEIYKKTQAGKAFVKYAATEIPTEIAEELVPDAIGAYYDPRRQFGDAQTLSTIKETAAATALFAVPGAGGVAIRNYIDGSEQNRLEALNTAIESTKKIAQAKEYKTRFLGMGERVDAIKEKSPAMQTDDVVRALDNVSPDEKMLYMDNEDFFQLEGSHPEIFEKIKDISFADESDFGPSFEENELLATLNQEEREVVSDLVREDEGAFTVKESDEFVEEEIKERFEGYMADQQAIGQEVTEEVSRIATSFSREVMRLQEQSVDAGREEIETAQMVEAGARSIMSNHPNDPVEGIKALKKINITREGVQLATGFDVNVTDPEAYKASINQFKKKMRSLSKEARATSKQIDKDLNKERRQNIKAQKEALKKIKSKAITVGKQTYLDRNEIAERASKVGPENTIVEALAILRPEKTGMQSAGVKGIGYKKDAMPIENVVETLVEKGLIEENDTNLFVQRFNEEVKGQQELDAIGREALDREEGYAKDLVERSKEVVSMGEAEALYDEIVNSDSVVPDSYLKQIEENIGKNLEQNIDELIGEREGDYDQQGNLTEEAKERFLKDSVVKEVVYHGTNAEFEAFDKELIGSATDAGFIGEGFYFHGDLDTVKAYGKIQMPVYLSLKNPYDFTGQNFSEVVKEKGGPKAFSQWLRDNGYDGATLWGQYMVLDPSQIKSTKARTFDTASDNIFEQRGKSYTGDVDPSTLIDTKKISLIPNKKKLKTPKDIAEHNAKVEVYELLEENNMLTDDVMFDFEGLAEEYLERLGDKRTLEEIAEEHFDEDLTIEDAQEWEAPETLLEWALLAKGETSDLNEAGYALPDGTLLDFSGAREGGGHGTRNEDHRQVNVPVSGSVSGTDLMIAMQDSGALRIDNQSGLVDATVEPTPEQYRVIRDIFDNNDGGYVDLQTPDGRRASFEVNDPKKGVGLIKRFFAGHDLEGMEFFQSAYHGTPHSDIVRFSMDKIGTGEGAQAYGYGLYFTGEREIAEWYKDKLSGGDSGTTARKLIETFEDVGIQAREFRFDELTNVARRYNNVGGDINETIAIQREIVEDHGMFGDTMEYRESKKLLDALETARERGAKFPKLDGGQTYKVEIPDSEDLLQWDKEISQQSDSIKKSIDSLPDKIKKALLLEAEEKDLNIMGLFDLTGKELMTMLTDTDAGFSLPDVVSDSNALAGDFREDKHTSLYLNSIGIPGLEYPAGELSGTTTDARNFVIWNEEAIEILDEAILNQQRQTGRRGSFSTRTKLITLMETANESTLPHEMVHAWVDDSLALIQSPNVNEEDKKLAIENIRENGKWMAGSGRKRALKLKERFEKEFDHQPISEETFFMELQVGGVSRVSQNVFQEMMSEGFEVFMWEGKAPNDAMKSVFIRFQKWLQSIYETMKDMIATGEMPELDDKIRDYYAQALSFDSEITAKQKEIILPTSYIESMGITTKAEAEEMLSILGKSYNEIAKNKQDYLRSELNKVRKDINAIAEATYKDQLFYPVVKEVEKTGPIERDSAVDMFGELAVSQMEEREPKLFDTKGQFITEVQTKVGMTDEELNEAFKDYFTQKEITDAAIEEKRAEINEEALNVAVFSDEKLIDIQHMLSNIFRGDRKPASKRQVRAFAREKLGKMTYAEATNTKKYIGIVSRLATERAQLVGKSKNEALSEAELKELFSINERIALNMAFVDESYTFQKSYDKAIKDVKKDVGTSNKKFTKRERYVFQGKKYWGESGASKYKDDFYAAASLLLDAIGVKNLSVDKKAEYLKNVKDKTLIDFVHEDILDDNSLRLLPNGFRNDIVKSPKSLTVEDFNSYMDITNNILLKGHFLSRPKASDGATEYTVEQGEAIATNEDNVRDKAVRKLDRTKMWDRVLGSIRQGFNHTTSLEYLLREFSAISNGEQNRGASRIIADTLSYAYDKKNTMITDYSKKLNPFRDYLVKKGLEVSSLWGNQVRDDLLFSQVREDAGMTFFSPEEVAMLPIHLGTEENYEKFKEGYGWDDAKVNAILEKYFTAEDMEMYQQAWNIMEQLYTPGEETLYRLRGKQLGKKEDRSFEFKGKTFKGGYAPATIDSQVSAISKKKKLNVEDDANIQNSNYKSSVFRHNYTPSALKTLTDVKYPLALNYNIVANHIEDMAHFINVQESMDYAKAITEENTEFGQLFIDKMGIDNYKLLNELLTSINSRDRQEVFASTIANFLIRRFREGVFIAKLPVRLVQLLGVFPAMSGLGAKGIGMALTRVPTAWSDSKVVKDKSDFMRNRADFLNHTMFAQVNDTKIDFTRKLTKGVAGWIGVEAKGATADKLSQTLAYAFIGSVDQFVATSIWMGKYKVLKAEGKSESEAITQADQLVRQTQDSNRAIDIVKGQRVQGFEKALFLFSSYQLRVYWQRHKAQFNHLMQDPTDIQRLGQFLGFVAIENMAPAFLSAVMYSIINGKDPSDEEEFENLVWDSIWSIGIGWAPVFGGSIANPQFGGPGNIYRNTTNDINKIKNIDLEDEDSWKEAAWGGVKLMNFFSPQPLYTNGFENMKKQYEKWAKD